MQCSIDSLVECSMKCSMECSMKRTVLLRLIRPRPVRDVTEALLRRVVMCMHVCMDMHSDLCLVMWR